MDTNEFIYKTEIDRRQQIHGYQSSGGGGEIREGIVIKRNRRLSRK